MRGHRTGSSLLRSLPGILLLAGTIALSVLPGTASGDPIAQAAPPGAPRATASAPLQPPDAVAGRTVYQTNCAPCHGTQGGGDGPSASGLSVRPTAFNDLHQIAGTSLAEMFNVVKNGRMDRMMPPWSSVLNDGQIWDALAYAWSLHTSPQEIDSGRALYLRDCASCHGAGGKGQAAAPAFDDLAATFGETQNDWLQAIADGRASMPGFAKSLSAAQQEAVAEYARSLGFARLFQGPLGAGPGIITGTVINGTTGQLMVGLPVTLTVTEGQSTAGSFPAKTDAAGRFKFGDLPADPSLAYTVAANYPAAVPYGTAATSFSTGTLSLDLSLHVFEPTNQAPSIRLDAAQLLIEFDPTDATLQIAELQNFSFEGNRTYVGDANHVVLRFTLPQGAEDLQISDGDLGQRYLQTADGFVDTLPLSPVTARQVLFRYAIPYSGTSADVAQAFPYPVASLNALVADSGEQVSSAMLADQGTQQTQMGTYRVLAGQDIAAGQAFTLHFANLPMAGSSAAAAASGSTAPRLMTALIGALAAAVGLTAISLAVWLSLRRRGLPAAAGVTAPTGGLRDENDLIDALARLDLAHEAGAMSDGEYRERRMVLKAQLLDMLRLRSAPTGQGQRR